MINVDNIIITIKDTEGVIIVDEEDMTFEETGTYLYNYDLSSDASIGLWTLIVKSTLDSIISIRNDSFLVVY